MAGKRKKEPKKEKYLVLVPCLVPLIIPLRDTDKGQGHGIKILFMDKDMDNNLLSLMAQDKDFQDFWAAYKPDELRFPNRKKATFRLWRTRIQPTRKAMLDYVKHNGAPKWKNPYFFVQEFPDSDPTNYNGARSLPSEPLVRAVYNGTGGIYTRREAMLFHMDIRGDFIL